MSTYLKMSPAATDDYAIYSDPVAVAPEPATAKPEPRGLRRAQRPEFYKPFHYLLLVYLFFYCSRIAEMLPYLHIGLVLQPIMLVGMFMTGGTKAMFRSNIGRLMTAFTVWMAICVPFSTWKGGSFNILLLSAQALLLMFFMAAFIRTLDDCYRVMYTIALGIAAVGVLSLVIGGGAKNDPRLGLGGGQDTLADANILALYLVLGMPFIWFSASWKKGIAKIGLIVAMLPILASLGRTGSRMGLIALVIAVGFFFLFANNNQRAVIVVTGVLAVALGVVLLPERMVERFTTFFQPHSAASQEAAESAESRKLMFQRGVQMTLEHPILGVGPGEFMDAEAREAASSHKRGMWRYTHNAYLEISSETGLPGLILFLLAFWFTYKGLTPFRNRFPVLRVRRAALFMQIAVLVTAIGAFFLSIAYSGILYAIMGLSAAFQIAAAAQYKALKARA